MQWKEGFSEADTLLALADGSGEEDDIGLGRNIRAMLGADEHVGARGKGPLLEVGHGRENTKQSYRLSSLLRHGV